MNWTIIVALKALPEAKSRLAPASTDPGAHAGLVEAIRADTLRAAAAVGRLLLVIDRVATAATAWPTIVQSRPGLNQALREAAEHAQAHWPDDSIAALVGDLPALQSGDLAAALALAAEHPRAFVADASGLGTTLLTAAPHVRLEPAFGPGSAARHRSIAVELPAAAGLRLDVDTEADLDQAQRLGLGPATRAQLLTSRVNPNRA